MYTLSVTMLSSAQIGFQFKQKGFGQEAEKALDEAFARADQVGEFVTIEDDYGRRARMRIDEIAAYFGCELSESLVGATDATLIQKRAEAAFVNKLNNDPALKLLAGTGQVRLQS